MHHPAVAPTDLCQRFNKGPALDCAPDLSRLARILSHSRYVDLTQQQRVLLLRALTALLLDSVELRAVLQRFKDQAQECRARIAAARASGRPKSKKKADKEAAKQDDKEADKHGVEAAKQDDKDADKQGVEAAKDTEEKGEEYV